MENIPPDTVLLGEGRMKQQIFGGAKRNRDSRKTYQSVTPPRIWGGEVQKIKETLAKSAVLLTPKQNGVS